MEHREVQKAMIHETPVTFMGEKWIIKEFHLKLCRDNSNMSGSTSNFYYSVFLKNLVTNTYAEALLKEVDENF